MPMKSIYYLMRASLFPLLLICLCLLLPISAHRQLVSRPITTLYNQYGNLEAFLLEWNSYSALYPGNYIKAIFPEPIHSSSNTVEFSLSTAHSLEVILASSSLPYVSANTYYFPISAELPGSVWYELKISCQYIPSVAYGLVRLELVSEASSANAIMYSWNDGFEYYHIEQFDIPSTLLEINLTSENNSQAGARQSISIEMTSLLAVNETVDVFIDFYPLSINTSNLTTTLNNADAHNGFSFVGSCHANCNQPLGYSCIHEESCSVSPTQIKITLPYLRLGERYQIVASVLNPHYVSKAGLEAYWKDDNGETLAIAFADQQLIVEPIVISSEQINLLWGIPYDTVVNEMGLGLFVNDPAEASQTLSSFDIGFSVSSVSPIEASYQVRMNVGATNILEESISHNLPSLLGTTGIHCRYELPEIICSGVDSFTQVSFRYYIRAKGYFTINDDLSKFGDVSIVGDLSQQALFVPLSRGLSLVTILNSDFHDYAGLHSPANGFNIRDTIITSHNDTLLPNSTKKSIQDFLKLPNSFVGIDASISPQQLQFFMNVPLSLMSLPVPTSAPQNFSMKLFINSNVMNSSSLGLDFAAYSSAQQLWGAEHVPCYVDSSTTATTQDYRCQKYDDHVHSAQIDNTFTKGSHYGLYEFMCGDGAIVTCPSGDCAADCNILRGGFLKNSMVDKSGGVLSIRNVTFLKDYHSPVEANKYALDFVIAFYQDSTFISASLINAYTLNRTRLSNLSASLTNVYHDSTLTYNLGDRVPTLLKISGHLTLAEAGSQLIESLQVYLPACLSVSQFLESDGSVGCSTGACSGFQGGSPSAIDTWTQQASVKVMSLPYLTNQFTILIPVQYLEQIPIFSISIVAINSQGVRLAGFRINGSSVSEVLQSTPNYFYTPVIATTLWTSGSPNWVDNPVHVFGQQIDLSLIKNYAVENVISMGNSTFDSDPTPSSTFTSIYFNIFSRSSRPLVDSVIDCVPPFSYTYLSLYPVHVLWCPLSSQALNQIRILYPLYPTQMGASFPFQLTFAYAYSSGSGHMRGYRLEDGSGGVASACTTLKSTEYQRDVSVPQENRITVNLGAPFSLIPSLRDSLMVEFKAPVEIPMTILECSALESSQSVPLLCSIQSQISNTMKLLLSLDLQEQAEIYEIELILKSIKSSASSVTTSKQYTINIYLPFTDSTSQPSYLSATLYSPYASMISTCSNSFTYSTFYAQEHIQLTDPIACKESTFGFISFNAEFGSSRSTFFDSSSLQISFTAPILNGYSRCTFFPDYQFWASFTVDATKTKITLFPSRRIDDFAHYLYTINCTSVIATTATVGISMKWMDGANTISTTQSIVYTPEMVQFSAGMITATLVKKLFNSVHYLSSYEIKLSLSVTGSEKVELMVDFPHSHVHNLFLECLYLNGTAWVPILCYARQLYGLEQVYLSFLPILASSFTIRIYGVLQESRATLPLIYLMLNKTDIFTLATTYYKAQVADSSPSLVANPPIEIYHFSVDVETQTLTLLFTVPFLSSKNIYLQLDELFRLQYGQELACEIQGLSVACSRVSPNLVLISVSGLLTMSANMMQTLHVVGLSVASYEEYDDEQVHFGLFMTLTDAGLVVAYGDHEHTEKPLLTSDLILPESLHWIIPHNPFNSKCQMVYNGYYGLPAILVSSLALPFKESFNLSSTQTSTMPLSLLDMAVELGTSQESLHTATNSSGIEGLMDYLVFDHDASAYGQIPSLPLCFSNVKCELHAEFDEYNIFSGGMTIPIAINMSKCKPMADMSVTVSLNTTHITADSTRTTSIANFGTDMLYIVLRHDSTLTIGSHSLQIALSSTDPATNSAFAPIPPLTIHSINRSLLIGNPEGKQPIVNAVNSTWANLTLECNSPATIYWGIGLYPTMLGISNEEIEARLVERGNGLETLSKDIYSWSEELYGLLYTEDFNVEKNLILTSLEGGLDYVFKYFCVDQTGRASGGKISYITTPPSDYSLVKLTLTYLEPLTYHQTNLIACAVCEQLSIPYNESITSTGSNCINETDVFHQSNAVVWDSQDSTGKYHYFFYMDTLRIQASSIVNLMYRGLGQNEAFLTAEVPYFQSMRVDQLRNQYEPVIYDSSLSIYYSSFTLSLDVGFANSYLIAAIMRGHFDPSTMSMPTHYLMKQGYFSVGTPFQQIYSIYGRDQISATFSSLDPGSKYSVFYFTTVDNSALNSRHSQVSYIDILTSSTLSVDLHEQAMLAMVMALFCLLMI